MRIPMFLLEEKLSDLVLDRNRAYGKGETTGYQAMIYEKEMKYPDSIVLIARGEDLEEEIIGKQIISVGKPSLNIMEKNAVLILKETCSCREVFQTVTEEILFLQEIEEKVLTVLKTDMSLLKLFQAVWPAFGNPMMMHDENFYRLACVDMEEDGSFWEKESKKSRTRIAEDILQDFQVDSEYLATMSKTEATIFPASMFGVRILYKNIYVRNCYRGRICINETRRPIGRGDIWLMEWFSGLVLDMLRLAPMEEQDKMIPLISLLADMTEGNLPTRKRLDQVLLRFGWTSRDDYFCVCFYGEGNREGGVSGRYQYHRLKESFPDSCIFQDGNRIIALFNTTVTDYGIDEFRVSNSRHIREGLLKVGISSVETDLMNYPYLLKQAEEAYRIGTKMDETFWTYCFDDYKNTFLLHTALREMPAYFLIHRELIRLMEYDTEHPSCLYKTLKLYLECERNIALTSEILNIHRTSLIYRIKRVKELTSLDLDDPKVRFELMLSYRLYEENTIE